MTEGDTALAQARSLNLQVVGMFEKGRFMEAKQLAEEALRFSRDSLGPRHAEVASALNNLAVYQRDLGNYVGAEPLLREALDILRETLGPRHPNVGKALSNLAGLRRQLGDYSESEVLFEQALELEREVLGLRHPEVATTLNNLGELHRHAGNSAAGEKCFREALEVWRGELGPRHPNVATGLNNLGLLLLTMGDLQGAKHALVEALDIRRDAFGPRHPSMAAALNSLAALRIREGDLPGATVFLEEALDISREILGPDHPQVASALSNLAHLKVGLGLYEEAKALLEESVELWRDLVGLRHPSAAATLHNLAGLHQAMGRLEKAEPLFRQVLEIRRATLDPASWEVAAALSNLAVLCEATGRPEEALELLGEAEGIQDRILADVFSVGSERRRLAFLETVRGQTDALVSLVLLDFPGDPDHVARALDLVLRRKAIGAEAFAAQRDAVLGGHHPELVDELRELTTLRMQIAQKALAGPGPEGSAEHRRMLREWEDRKESLEAQLAGAIPEIRLEERLRAADRDAVAGALPGNSVLVEFVRFRPFDFTAVPARKEPWWQAARYVAFVLPAAQPDEIRMVDLGVAGPIDLSIARYRDAVVGQGRDRAARGEETAPVGRRTAERSAGVELRKAVFDPLTEALGGRTRVFLAPDGDLTRVPFEVLPADGGGRLIEDYVFSYLSTARDVLRFEAPVEDSENPLVAAAPDFDLRGRPSSASPPGPRSRDLDPSRIHFQPLEGTESEGRAIGRILGASPWMRDAVLEALLKAARSPRILHVATHGFFLPDPEDDREAAQLPIDPAAGTGPLRGDGMDNPLLRSGLALAGANTFLAGGPLPPDAEDGILTAEDVSGLDLLGTELVVLSACETGLGQVRVGEGVFGLRRAFVLAGARTLVMSLWKVPDGPSAGLMQAFYENLEKGMGRAEALREAQLSLAAVYPPPWFWGAFICQGDPGPLGGDGMATTARKRSEPQPATKESAEQRPPPEPDQARRTPAREERPSFRQILAWTDLNSIEGPEGALGFPFSDMRTRPLAVQAQEAEKGIALFAVDLPELPEGEDRERALLSLLAASFTTSYARGILQASAPWLIAEVPLSVLTPEIAAGLVRGLAVLADLESSELGDPKRWTQAVGGCLTQQSETIRIDPAEAGTSIREVFNASGYRVIEVGEGAIVVALGVVGPDPDVFVLWDERVISLTLRMGTPPSATQWHLEQLLTLNGTSSVAGVGFDQEGALVVNYDVPRFTKEVMEHARGQLATLLQEIRTIFAGA